MTKDEALKLSMEAMEITGGFDVEINAIKEALAQPEQEPVAILHRYPSKCRMTVEYTDEITEVREGSWPLYTTPPQRKPLTDEEIWDEVKAADLDWQTGWSLDEDASNRYITFARAIEAAHGIKGEA